MSEANIKFYTSWFCPFAQRAWIALLHRKVPFQLNEVDPYNKSPEWLSVNPRGLVPALIHNNRSIYESALLIEYIEESFNENGKPLMPADPFSRFQHRLWGDMITKKFTPEFYGYLMKQDAEQREVHRKKMEAVIRELFTDLHGDYFGGDDIMYADIMLIPFALRFDILKHYRGFEIPSDIPKFHSWLNRMVSHPSVVPTIAERQKMIDIYQRYADNSAKSQVADAVRQGRVLP